MTYSTIPRTTESHRKTTFFPVWNFSLYQFLFLLLILPLMDPSTADWTSIENKAFKNALAEVDLNSSNWFEHLIAKFPNKTPEQLRDHYLDHTVDIERMESGQFPNPAHTSPWTVEATETEDLLVMDLPYSPGFSGSMCSGARSMLVPGKKLEEEDLVLPVDKGAKEAMLTEETMRENSFFTIAEGLMEESTNEVVEQELLVPKIQGREILSSEITEGKNEALSQKTDGIKMLEDLLMENEMEMVLPEAISEAQRGKRVLEEVAGVAEGKMLAADLGTSALTKGKQWNEEEHRLFLVGLDIHGKGAWRSIAKNFVHTRTSTQVASHAQKYFNRQLEKRQKRRRGSVLDITTIPKTIEPYQVTPCDSINTNNQTQLNNANQSSTSMPLPEMDCVQMAPNSLCQTKSKSR